MDPVCFWTIRVRQYLHGSGSFQHQQKQYEKPCFYVFVTSVWPLSLKNYVNVPLKSKTMQNIFCWLFLKVTDEKSRIRRSVARIRGSGFVPKCHGYPDPYQMSWIHTTLVEKIIPSLFPFFYLLRNSWHLLVITKNALDFLLIHN